MLHNPRSYYLAIYFYYMYCVDSDSLACFFCTVHSQQIVHNIYLHYTMHVHQYCINACIDYQLMYYLWSIFLFYIVGTSHGRICTCILLFLYRLSDSPIVYLSAFAVPILERGSVRHNAGYLSEVCTCIS